MPVTPESSGSDPVQPSECEVDRLAVQRSILNAAALWHGGQVPTSGDIHRGLAVEPEELHLRMIRFESRVGGLGDPDTTWELESPEEPTFGS